MIKNCPFCGKAFDVIRPQLWKFKENNVYFCTYTCKRAHDRKEENEMKAISKEQKQQAVRIALDGGDPKPFLAVCGSKAPDKLWYYIKNTLKTKDPETYEKLAKAAGMKKQVETTDGEYAKVKVDGPIRIETPEKDLVKVIETPKKPDEFEKSCRVTALDTPIGEFHYDKRHGYLDWDWDNSTMSLNVEEWKEFRKWFPVVLQELGVDL